MKHHHHHTHSFSWKHLKEEPICLASVIYNILVVLIELVILGFVTHMSLHDLWGYEGLMQLIHLVGIVLLGIVNYIWIHNWSKYEDTNIQSTGKFLGVSVVIFVAHILLLHVIPRVIGFELHHHEDGGASEMVEYMALAGIIVFVTLAFRYKDTILKFFNVQNKYMFRFQKPEGE